MKKNIKIAFIVACCLNAFSCNVGTSSTEHKIVHTYHSNGKTATQTSFLKGKKDGIYKEWFPGGNLQLERSYFQDELISEKLYTNEGEIIKNIVIKDGRKYGLMYSSFCVNGIASNPTKDSIVFKTEEQ